MSNAIMERARALVERHLTTSLVKSLRDATLLKSTGLGIKSNQFIGVIKVDLDDKAFWSVEQRFGFPYQEISDRDVRRVVWGALEAQDEPDQLRIVFLDMKNNHASSLRIALTSGCNCKGMITYVESNGIMVCDKCGLVRAS